MDSNIPILLCGESGTGKTSTFRNLDHKKSILLNVEEKPMPYKGESLTEKRIKSYTEFMKALKYLESDKGQRYTTVVIDSFTSLMEMIEQYAEVKFSGYDRWKQYALIAKKIITRLKRMKQQVILVALPEQKEEAYGDIKAYVKVKGKEMKYGWVESQFMVVLFTKTHYNEDSDEGELEDVSLVYRPNRRNTAKSPDGMFEGNTSK